MTQEYHYTQCGLDNVYLRNGYEIRETRHGTGIAIHDADGLHRAIALEVVNCFAPIRGMEVRFLRSQLNLSQDALGRILGCSRATIARWEGDPETPISEPSDRLLRVFVAATLDGDTLARKITEMLREIDRLECQKVLLEDTEHGWIRAAA